MIGLFLLAKGGDLFGTVFAWIIVLGVIFALAGWCWRMVTDPFRGSGGRCPYCRKALKSGSFVCHHCGRDKRTGATTSCLRGNE